jgi:TldD protein
MKEKITAVLSFLNEHQVDFADLRVHDIKEEQFSTENRQVQSMTTSRTRGYGIRVFLDGSLGFAGSQDFARMEETAMDALAIARASRLAQKEPVRLSPQDATKDHYQTPIKIDPFQVSKKDKLDLLFAAEDAMRTAVPELFKTAGFLQFRREEKTYADTHGSYITQALYQSGGGIEALAANQQDVQHRSYPNSFRGNFATGGYEFINGLNLVENAPRIAKEAMALLQAEECPAGVFDLVIDSSQMVLQIHESVGHPIELDRVFGYEAGYAGTSFISPAMMGFQYGSDHVNIVADATCPGGLGTFGYDDEGVKAQVIPIVTGGALKTFCLPGTPPQN